MFKKLAPHLLRGQYGEKLAARFLQKQGLSIVAKNVRSRHGEIDLVAQDGSYIVFVEVRLRQKNAPVSAAQSINTAKQKKWKLTAQDYLQKHYKQPPDCRFDAVLITENKKQDTSIEWIKGIVL